MKYLIKTYIFWKYLNFRRDIFGEKFYLIKSYTICLRFCHFYLTPFQNNVKKLGKRDSFSLNKTFLQKNASPKFWCFFYPTPHFHRNYAKKANPWLPITWQKVCETRSEDCFKFRFLLCVAAVSIFLYSPGESI